MISDTHYWSKGYDCAISPASYLTLMKLCKFLVTMNFMLRLFCSFDK